MSRKNVTDKDTPEQLTPEEIKEQESIVYAWDELPEPCKERLVAIKDLRRKGITIHVIAKLLGVSPRTIHRDLQALKEAHCQYVRNFDQLAEIGDTISFYEEIENRFMELMRLASEDNEELVWRKDEGKNISQVVAQIPDHAAISRYGSLALAARKAKTDLLQKTGMVSIVPDKIEINAKYDVSKMSCADLEKAGKEVCQKIAETQERIKRITGPDPLAEYDHLWEN